MPDTPPPDVPRPDDSAPTDPPPVSAMDRVQDRGDYLDERYERDYNRRYVAEHGDHSGFRGAEQTDEDFREKNPDAPVERRDTFELIDATPDAPPEAAPATDDPVPEEPTLGSLFLEPDDDLDGDDLDGDSEPDVGGPAAELDGRPGA